MRHLPPRPQPIATGPDSAPAPTDHLGAIPLFLLLRWIAARLVIRGADALPLP